MKNKIKNYLEKEELELEEIDLDNKNIDEIKINLIELSEYFLKYFNNLKNKLKDSKDNDIKEFMKNNQEIFFNILNLYSEYKNTSIEVGKSDIKRKLINYIQKKYFEINTFIDIYIELNDE